MSKNRRRARGAARSSSDLFAGKPYIHWGEWIKRRGLFIGFRRTKDLIDSVGCEQTTFFNWARSAKPPARMQKGFDLSLARALKVDRQMLFTNWVHKRPEQAPMIDVDADDSAFGERKRNLDRLTRMIPFIEDDGLKEMVSLAQRLHQKSVDSITDDARAAMYGGKPPPLK